MTNGSTKFADGTGSPKPFRHARNKRSLRRHTEARMYSDRTSLCKHESIATPRRDIKPAHVRHLLSTVSLFTFSQYSYAEHR